MRSWSLVLIILFHLSQRSTSCGISTHIEIAHRALEFFSQQHDTVNFKKLLLEHQDAYQAGSAFPDAFYPDICKGGTFRDVSEDTHWTPFLNASIHYIRQNHPLPWEKDTEKLVAFLFGIASHMVADVSWHSLGIEQGFLQTMGQIDFHGSYSDAHPIGDFGGDVLSHFELDFNYLGRSWYIPVKDLMGIYKQLYGKEVITKNAIIDCSYLQFLELYGERLVLSKLYPNFAKRSPFLVDQFQDYFLGGLDDMAFWTTNMFHLTSYMLQNGTSDCTLPENPLFVACGPKHNDSLGTKLPKNKCHATLNVSLAENAKGNINYTERGVFFSVDSWAQDSVSFLYLTFTKKIRRVFASEHPHQHNYITNPIASYFLSFPYVKLGWSMISADLNQDGHEDLVVGAPGYSRSGHVQVGRVYLLYSNDIGLPPVDLDLDKEAHLILEGFQPSGRFGSSLAVLDFNQDGLLDLAVGAPSVGAKKLTYNGAVYVFFGTKKGKISSQPNVTISCQDKYCNLGWTLLAADINEDGAPDLVVGSPYAPSGGKQRGIVAAFYSDAIQNIKGQLNVEEANWMVKGEDDYAWFGYSIHSLILNNRTLLLVGSPTWKNMTGLGNTFYIRDEKQSIGKVYGYYPPSRQSWFTISGDKAMEKLGTSLSSGVVEVNGVPRQVLLVGAPTRDDKSKMAFLSMTLQQGGSTRIYDLTAETGPSLLSIFSGDRRFSRFGGMVHLRDLDDDGLDEIIISAPLRTGDFTGGLLGGEDGRVYIYNGKNVSLGDATSKCKSWTSPCPEEKAQHVLISLEESSRFGSSVVTVKSKTKNQVVVAAGRSSMGARLAGTLHIYDLGVD
ncbi:phosphatidylinositol-glycan-specific phospholipase D isoform X2 [Trichosurus vulpecula]|uniref:phosphatidylinositol-glycan-specific phospholipase D isoform X2 n=1 Tax=Trichosurus vulpecula TaxID=9337 RepID=UPI00186AE741|nr:phosphatidylinositol-glycan-specific phospholipase D isoform X2 [Trichosurus vulpecula]